MSNDGPDETNRFANGYQPNFDVDMAVGRQGEAFVGRVIEALETGASIEVKTDAAASKWGRVYLETACLYGDEYRHSGLSATSAELWAQVLEGDVAVIAPTWRFRYAAKKAWKYPDLRRQLTRGSHPTHGLVVPLDKLLVWLMEAPPTVDPAKPWE